MFGVLRINFAAFYKKLNLKKSIKNRVIKTGYFPWTYSYEICYNYNTKKVKIFKVEIYRYFFCIS